MVAEWICGLQAPTLVFVILGVGFVLWLVSKVDEAD